jgi:hypothetical protein
VNWTTAVPAAVALTEKSADSGESLMDTFDLKWPQTDATFYTDGWRCRIVWREKRGGLGGTIDNNDQAKARVAGSLVTAPYLLSALRARGHGLLAEEIETIAGAQMSGKVIQGAVAAPPKAAPRESTGSQISNWLQLLQGEDRWEQVSVRRSKVWHPCAQLGDVTLQLKAPAPKGKPEWVLRQTFADKKRRTLYIAAPALKGICCWLHENGLFRDAAATDRWLTGIEALEHPAVAQAVASWRTATTAATH